MTSKFNIADLPGKVAFQTIVGDGGCWLWQGRLNTYGYGLVWFEGKYRYVHVLSYLTLVGPIPEGLVLDHVRARGCTAKNCLNPAHLEPVTPGENALRGSGPPSVNARKTHCIHGHEFTPENTRVAKDGHRRCKTCERIQWQKPERLAKDKAWRERNRAKAEDSWRRSNARKRAAREAAKG